MALKTNTAEGGTNGTGATTGNTGGASGDSFATVSPGAGGTIAFSTAQAAHGSLSYAFSPASGVTCYVLFDEASPSGTSFSARRYIYLTGYPSAETSFFHIYTAANANIAYMNIKTDGTVRISNSAGTTLGSGTNAIPLNTWTRIALFGTVNATTGTVNYRHYPGDSATAGEILSYTNVNTGSTAPGRTVTGRFTASGTMATFYVDDFAQDLQSSTEIGSAGTPDKWTYSKFARFG